MPNPPRQAIQWPQTFGDFALMGPVNRCGKWRWYKRNIIIDGALVTERIKFDNYLLPIWESLTHT